MIELKATIGDRTPAIAGDHYGYVRIVVNHHFNHRGEEQLTAVVAKDCKGASGATSFGNVIILAAEVGQGKSLTQLLSLGNRFAKKLKVWWNSLPEADQMSYIETLEVPEAVYSFVGVAGSHREP